MSVFKVVQSVSATVFINNRKSQAQGKKKKKTKKNKHHHKDNYFASPITMHKVADE